MATLTAWKFDTPKGAEQAEEVLVVVAKARLLAVEDDAIEDGAVVSWEQGRLSPTTHQLRSLPGGGALGGQFWGFLFGLLFFMPALGLEIGNAGGPGAGSVSDAGIDDGFVATVRAMVTPGTSALFLLTTNGVRDAVRDEIACLRPELVESNLSYEQEDRLREFFAAA